MKKKTIGIFISIVSLIFISVFIYGTGKPEYGSDFSSCHGTPSNISIEITGSEEISANISSYINFTIIATGENLFVLSMPGIFDNDLFLDLPTDEITDNSLLDLDLTPNIIEVDFNITTPATEGYYTLFIMAAKESFDGDDLAYVSVYVTVGGIDGPPPSTEDSPLALFLANYNYYLGGLTIIFLSIGIIFFQINLSKNRESKIHGIFMIIGFILTTVNIFLILNDTLDFTFKSMELTNNQIISQLIHTIVGSIGYITGIVVLFGTFTYVPGSKMKLFAYIMLLAWTFNFVFEFFMPTGG